MKTYHVLYIHYIILTCIITLREPYLNDPHFTVKKNLKAYKGYEIPHIEVYKKMEVGFQLG